MIIHVVCMHTSLMFLGKKVLIHIPSHLGFPIHTKIKRIIHVLFHHIFFFLRTFNILVFRKFPMLCLVGAAILDFRPKQQFKCCKGHSF